jgi:Asp-tRNA(Asn)/Glu-tRNA(Gln) amidotransferase A subunit family amidase
VARDRLERMQPLGTSDLPAPDRAAVAAALAQLLAVPPDLGEGEPAVLFHPLRAAGQERMPPWPDPPPGGDLSAPEAGPLEADLAAVAQGASPEAPALAYRQRIARWNEAFRVFLTVCPPDHPQARPGTQGLPLAGAWLAVKDIVDTEGLPTTAGSRLRAGAVARRDAWAWARLRAAGAALLGKTNTHEFAAGTTGENDAFGAVPNPYDPRRVAGGSSSGSAAAVALGLAPASLGTDTGGSVRIPAALCGVVGFKPTYGRVSRRGVVPLSWTLDHVGVLARTVRDAAVVFAAMAGPDPEDPTTWDQPPLPPWEQIGRPRPGGLRGLVVGAPEGWVDCHGSEAAATGGLPTAAEVQAAWTRTLLLLEDLGARVVPCDLGSPDRATAVNRWIALAESATVHAEALARDPAGFGPRVRGRLLAGRFLRAEEYLAAQVARTRLCRLYARALTGPLGIHLVATPTVPTLAPFLGARPEEALALLRFTAPFDVVGWPAVTLPVGIGTSGLPLAVQLAAGPGRDAELLAAAAALEAALGEEAHPSPALPTSASGGPL